MAGIISGVACELDAGAVTRLSTRVCHAPAVVGG